MQIFKLYTSFCISLIFFTTCLLAQKPYNAELVINSFLDKYPLSNKDISFDFYSVSGLKEAEMYDIGISGLADFNTRETCYTNILREIALQNDFDVTNLLQVYNCKNASDLNSTIDFYKEIGKWSGISFQFLKVLSEKTSAISNSGGAELSGIKKVITNVSKSDLKNLSTLLNVYSAVANGADFVNKDTYLSHYTLLLKAAQFDIGLNRMKDLKAQNIITDPAYSIALNSIISEMQNFPADYWSRYYYAIKMNPNEAKVGFSSFTKMGLNVASLMSTAPSIGWAKAVVSVAETIDMIVDWNEKWREVTLAGTIYYNLSKSNLSNNVNLVDMSDFSQFLFLKKFNFCMQNKYLKVWEYVKKDQKQVRLFIENEKTKMEASVLDKRLSYWMEPQGNVLALANNKKNTFTDPRDGKVYKTVQIGNQVWFAQNLAYKSGHWESSAYMDIENLAKIYGYLYNWDAANDVCPDGWHLPSKDEWKLLIDLFGGKEQAGLKLKEAGSLHWRVQNEGNNISGFTALPGGLRDFSSNEWYYENIGSMGAWWSSSRNTTMGSENESYCVEIFANNEVRELSERRWHGFSVRCIKDR